MYKLFIKLETIKKIKPQQKHFFATFFNSIHTVFIIYNKFMVHVCHKICIFMYSQCGNFICFFASSFDWFNELAVYNWSHGLHWFLFDDAQSKIALSKLAHCFFILFLFIYWFHSYNYIHYRKNTYTIKN